MNPPNITLRKPHLKDIDEIHKTGMETDGFVVSEKSRFLEVDQLETWIKENKDDVLLVAEIQDKLAGYCFARLHVPTGEATIDNLYVMQSFRKQGVAKTLVAETVRQLKQKGAKYIYALTKTTNTPTLNLLSSCGFHKGYDFTWMEITPE